MPDMERIRTLESAAAAAMPALVTRYYDGWLLRFANGYTRRANSIHPLYGNSLELGEKIQHCEAVYTAAQLPILFKITDAATPSDLDLILLDRGYTLGTGVHVQTLALHNDPASPPVPGAAMLSPEWLSAYCTLNDVAEAHQPTLRAMLERITAPTWYALLGDETSQHPRAVALGVLTEGLLGIFDVVVAAALRRQGIGQALMRGLLAWGHSQGARQAYLQVSAENTPARQLYERLGFGDAYRYWYRLHPGLM